MMINLCFACFFGILYVVNNHFRVRDIIGNKIHGLSFIPNWLISADETKMGITSEAKPEVETEAETEEEIEAETEEEIEAETEEEIEAETEEETDTTKDTNEATRISDEDNTQLTEVASDSVSDFLMNNHFQLIENVKENGRGLPSAGLVVQQPWHKPGVNLVVLPSCILVMLMLYIAKRYFRKTPTTLGAWIQKKLKNLLRWEHDKPTNAIDSSEKDTQSDDSESFHNFMDNFVGVGPFEDPNWLPEDRNDLPYGIGLRYAFVVQYWRPYEGSGDGGDGGDDQPDLLIDVESGDVLIVKRGRDAAAELDDDSDFDTDVYKSFDVAHEHVGEWKRVEETLVEIDVHDMQANDDKDAREATTPTEINAGAQLLIDIENLDDFMKCLTLRNDSRSTDGQAMDGTAEDLLFFNDQQVEELSNMNAHQGQVLSSSHIQNDEQAPEEPSTSIGSTQCQEIDTNVSQRALDAAKLEKYRVLDAIVEQQVKKLTKSLCKAKKAEPIQMRELYVNQNFTQSSETDLEEPNEISSSMAAKQPDHRKSPPSEYPVGKDARQTEQSHTLALLNAAPNMSKQSAENTSIPCKDDPKAEQQLTQVVQMYADLAFTDHSDEETTARNGETQQGFEQHDRNNAPRFSDPQSMEHYIETIMKVYQPSASEATAEPRPNANGRSLPSQVQREDLIAFSKVPCNRGDETKELKRSGPTIADVAEHNLFAKRSRQSEATENPPPVELVSHSRLKSLDKLNCKASGSNANRNQRLNRDDAKQSSNVSNRNDETPESQQDDSNPSSSGTPGSPEFVFYDPNGEPVRLQLAVLEDAEKHSQ